MPVSVNHSFRWMEEVARHIFIYIYLESSNIQDKENDLWNSLCEDDIDD